MEQDNVKGSQDAAQRAGGVPKPQWDCGLAEISTLLAVADFADNE